MGENIVDIKRDKYQHLKWEIPDVDYVTAIITLIIIEDIPKITFEMLLQAT